MRIQLKRSSTLLADGSAKPPSSAQMEYGELAVNFNNDDPAIFLKDTDNNIVRISGSGSLGQGTAEITLDAGPGLYITNPAFTLDQTADQVIDVNLQLETDDELVGLEFASNKLRAKKATSNELGTIKEPSGIGIYMRQVTPTGEVWVSKDATVALPDGYPNLNDGDGNTLDARYLNKNIDQTYTGLRLTINQNLTVGNDIDANNINASGTITGNVTGDLTGNADTATSATSATNATNATTAANVTRSVVAGDGLTGGGELTADRTINVNANDNTITVDANGIAVNQSALNFTPAANNGQININATNGLTATGNNATANQGGNTTRTISGVDATTSAKGVVQLENSYTSTSQTTAATANAVRVAYDRVEQYAPSKTGTNASGTWGIDITGNAATATVADSVLGNIATADRADEADSIKVDTLTTNANYAFLFAPNTTDESGSYIIPRRDTANTCFINPSTNTIGASALKATGRLTVGNGIDLVGRFYSAGQGANSFRFAKSSDASILGSLSFEGLSASRTYTFPNAGGTIALTSSNITGNAATATNADKVDNLHASSFLRSDANDSASGELTLNGKVNFRTGADFADDDYIYMGSSDDFRVNFNSNGWLYINQVANGIIFQDNGTNTMRLQDEGVFRPETNNVGTLGTSSANWATVYTTKVVTPEIERSGSITVDANGAGADVTLSAADHIILGAGAEEDGSIYFRGNSGADSYRFAKSGQTGTEGFLSFESLSADRTFTFPNATGTIALTSSTVSNATNATNCSRSITGGNGLTGGGVLNANRTLNVGAGSGISVGADAVAVDGTVLRTTGNQSKSGTMSFSDTVTVQTINVRNAIDLADNDYLRFGSGDDCEMFTNGSHMYMDLNSGIGNFYIRDGTTTRYTFNDNGTLTASRFASTSLVGTDVAFQKSGDTDTGYGFNSSYDFCIYASGGSVIQGGKSHMLIGNGSSQNLDPGSTGTGWGMYMNSTGQTTFKRDSSNNSTNAMVVGGETGRLEIRNDGDLLNTNNRYQQISDVRLKENIVDAKSQWEDIKNLRWVNWNWKPETNMPTHTQLGVIAQEAEEICPGVVSYGEVEDQVWSKKIKDQFKPLAKEGKTYDEYKAVAYSIIAMKSAKALQEAILRIEELEAKVAALEGN